MFIVFVNLSPQHTHTHTKKNYGSSSSLEVLYISFEIRVRETLPPSGVKQYSREKIQTNHLLSLSVV